MSCVSIIIPALNEAESIGHVVRSMPWNHVAECIVVDNGSTDATADVAREAGARVISSPRGYGAACLAGSRAAVSTSTILVYLDGDGSDIVADLPRLTGPILSEEADFVLGSRIRGSRERGSMLPSQILAAHLVSTLLRLPLDPEAERGSIQRHGTVSGYTESILRQARDVRTHLWLEPGDADQGASAQPAHPGDCGRLPAKDWR